MIAMFVTAWYTMIDMFVTAWYTMIDMFVTAWYTHFVGHDAWEADNTLGGTTVSLEVRLSSTLSVGVQYYSNVIAYGLSGIHHTESSDGFRTDKVAPIAGVVFDGIGEYIVTLYTESSDGFRTDKVAPIAGVVFDGIGEYIVTLYTESSDGFRTDKVAPIAGVVFDGIGKFKFSIENI